MIDVLRFDTFVINYPPQLGVEAMAADRRAGRVPHVGKEPRARTKSGAWRKKRGDAGKHRKTAGKGFLSRFLGAK